MRRVSASGIVPPVPVIKVPENHSGSVGGGPSAAARRPYQNRAATMTRKARAQNVCQGLFWSSFLEHPFRPG